MSTVTIPISFEYDENDTNAFTLCDRLAAVKKSLEEKKRKQKAAYGKMFA